MPRIRSNNTMQHLPAFDPLPPPSGNVAIAGGGARTITLPSQQGLLPLIMEGVTVTIDPTMHTPENVVNRINAAGIPGVSAAIDRYGNLALITPSGTVSGNAVLLQNLGLT